MSFTMPTVASVTLMATTGFALGIVYFAALRRTAALVATGGVTLRALAFTLARGAAAIGVLGFAAWLGAAPLLSAFGGFLLARSSALRRVRRAT